MIKLIDYYTVSLTMELDPSCYNACPITKGSYWEYLLYGMAIFAMVMAAMVIYIFRPKSEPLTKWKLLSLWLGTGLSLSLCFFRLLKMIGTLHWTHDIVNCQHWGLYERMSLVLMPVTMLALFFDSTKDARVYNESKLGRRIGILTYAMALVLSFPEVFNNNGNKCLDKLISDWNSENGDMGPLNWREIQVFYETIFTIIITLPPSYFMIRFLFQMKIKMSTLHLTKPYPPYMQPQVEGLRWTCAYILFFHLIYLIPSLIILGVTIGDYYDDEEGQVSNLQENLKLARDFMLLILYPIFFLKFRFWNIFPCGLPQYQGGQFWRIGLTHV